MRVDSSQKPVILFCLRNMTAPAPFSGGQPYFIEIQPFLCPRNNGISYPASVIKLIRHMKAKYNFGFFSVDFKMVRKIPTIYPFNMISIKDNSWTSLEAMTLYSYLIGP